jgi:hypothetical protein
MLDLVEILKSRMLQMGALCVLVLLVGATIFLKVAWPFRQEAVIKDLEKTSLSKVRVGVFHTTYFPRPGCVLEHVTFQHNPKAGTSPLITIERVRIEANFAGLFSKHLKLVRAEGMHLFIPPRGSEHFDTPQRSSVVIDDLIADGATLEVGSAGNSSLKFAFHGFTISNVGSSGPASFKATLSNAVPPAKITTSGKFGPWNSGDVGKTDVSGEYSFQEADLGAFDGIGGMLSSSGKFKGKLEHIEVEGVTDVPSFAVALSSHRVRLQTKFRAVVNAKNGDTFLEDVNVRFAKTSVSTRGSIAGETGQTGKTASLEMESTDGRIQDLLMLFSKSPRPPMSGTVTFRAKVSLPSQPRLFLERIELQGDFGIDAGNFSKPDTQHSVDALSRGARGEKPPNDENDKPDPQSVLSDLKGHVLLKDGTARFSNLSFSVPGAFAQMQGTYDLISERVNLHGTLKTEEEVSKTTHGVKAVMMKMLDPFLKRKRGDYLTPVKITGTYEHPKFGLDIGGREHKKQTANVQRGSNN